MASAVPGAAAASTPAPPTSAPDALRDAGPRLPGVVNDLDDAPPKRKIAPIRDNRPAIDRVTERQAAETAGVHPENLEPESARQETETPEQENPEAEETPTEKYVFGGIEFESQAAAEHSFKTLRGQHKALETKSKAALSERNQAVTVANQWKAEAERMRAELEGRGSVVNPKTQTPKGTAPTSEAQQTAEAQKAFEESVDWDFYKELYETKGPQFAQFYLARQTRTFMTEFVKRELGQVIAPFQEQRQAVERVHTVAGLFERVAGFNDDGGNAYFPELFDDAAAPVIARIYTNLGFDPSGDKPELGVHYAVMAYREWLARQGGGATAPSPSTAAPAAPLLRHLNAEQQAQSQALTGNGTPRPATAAQSPELQLKKSIREANTFHPGLGFAPLVMTHGRHTDPSSPFGTDDRIGRS